MPRSVIGVILVISFRFAGEQNMPAMMEVVVPLRGKKAWPAVFIPFKPMRLIIIVLEDQMDFPVGNGGADSSGEFRENVRLTIVGDRMYGIEAQSVKVKF